MYVKLTLIPCLFEHHFSLSNIYGISYFYARISSLLWSSISYLISDMFAGMLMGVFDGHGGGACAQVVSKRLFHYISACLLPPKLLEQYLNSVGTDKKLNLLETFNDKVEFLAEIKDLYQASFITFVRDLVQSNSGKEFQMEKALENAFYRLDNDLSNEALLQLNKKDAARTLAVAMSGTVAAVAHIDGPHLHVAGVGDCKVVLGVLSGLLSLSLSLLSDII